jgi:hypothetical protein
MPPQRVPVSRCSRDQVVSWGPRPPHRSNAVNRSSRPSCSSRLLRSSSFQGSSSPRENDTGQASSVDSFPASYRRDKQLWVPDVSGLENQSTARMYHETTAAMMPWAFSTSTPLSYPMKATSLSSMTMRSVFCLAETDGSEPRLEDWKRLVQEILESLNEEMHKRFHRGELHLSRLNTIHCTTQWPLFDPCFRTWRHYEDLFRENFTWLATGTVFVALVLTAMQVGLATDQLRANDSFQSASEETKSSSEDEHVMNAKTVVLDSCSSLISRVFPDL